jgi:hypothetical protein
LVNNELLSGSMPDRHLMVDIETLDVEISAAIVAIGAVVFDPRGEELGEEFSVTISKASNRRECRTVSERTMEWWAMQSPEAQAAVFEGDHQPLGAALDNFTRWINRLDPTCTRVWAKSPDFDCSILKHACDHFGFIWPFKFWETRCCRTILELAYPEGEPPFIDVEGPKHDALHDAKVQAHEVQHAFHVLNC